MNAGGNDDYAAILERSDRDLYDLAKRGSDIEYAQEHDPLIKLVLERAADEAGQAAEALFHVEPGDTRAVQALQFKVRLYRAIVGWIDRAVVEGRAALVALDARRAEGGEAPEE